MKRVTPKNYRLTRAQHELLMFRAPPHPKTGLPQIEECGIFGEFGGGKTFLAALRAMVVMSENPSEDHHDPLITGISAPTAKSLITGPMTALRRHGIPIKVDRSKDSRDPHWVLRNNHKVMFYTGHGSLDGPNLVQFWADEFQDRSYIGEWANIVGRIRDVGPGRGLRLNAQASGIATEGYVASIFRNPSNPLRMTKLLFPEANASNLPPGYADRVRSAAVGGRTRDPDGWMIPEGLFYPAFSRERNMDPVAHFDRSAFHGLPTDISVDLGNRGAVTWWQPIADWPVSYGSLGVRRETVWVCFDQWMPSNIDAPEMARTIAQGDWLIQPGTSTIALDPTAEIDQINAFREQFPNVRIVMAPRNSFYWFNANGERAVSRAICDGNDSARMFVHPDLEGDDSGRGVIEALRGYRRDKPRDKHFEDAADSVRYQIQGRLPIPNVRPKLDFGPLGSEAFEGDQWWKS